MFARHPIVLGLALGASGLLAGAAITVCAAAERPKAVVELFTSQGCNSCPPADAYFAHLADQPGLIALAYHIDYWDYLGWKDTLARAENTKRQRGYVEALNGRSVYTPQLVVNGRAQMNGADSGKVESALAAGSTALSVDLSMKRVGDSVVIEAGSAAEDGPRKAHVVLVYFTPRTDIEVQRGENAGKSVSYRNAVTAIQAAGMWKGAAGRWEIPYSEIEKHGAEGAAVLLQSIKEGMPGPILGAAVLETPGKG